LAYKLLKTRRKIKYILRLDKKIQEVTGQNKTGDK